MRLSHAYITNSADALAMSAVCSGTGQGQQRQEQMPCRACVHCGKVLREVHPDIAVIEPVTREITVGQIRELVSDAHIVPNEASKKVYIISPADLMNTPAQNALLKLLEDPPAHVVIILKTASPRALLPTVRSRCVLLKPGPEIDSRDDEDAMVTGFFDALERGGAQFVEFMFRLEKLSREDFEKFLADARAATAQRLRSPGTIPPSRLSQLERVLAGAQEYLDLNVGTGHIGGLICASLL